MATTMVNGCNIHYEVMGSGQLIVFTTTNSAPYCGKTFVFV